MKLLSLFTLSFIAALLSCSIRNGPVHPRDNPYDAGGISNIYKFTATIYEPDGNEPAVGARVSIYIAGIADSTIPQSFVMPLSRYTTDDRGRFEIIDLPVGMYNLLGEKDPFVLFQDSLLVTSTYTTLRDDTLECQSSLSGIVAVEPNHDPRTVTIHLPGTGRWPVAADSSGRFMLTGLASGKWPLFFSSTVPGYLPASLTATVTPCTATTIDDTIRLAYTGIPIVKGIRAAEDTLHGMIRLAWEKTDYEDFKDYAVYRDVCGKENLSTDPLQLTDNTFIIDSTYVSVITTCLRYRVAVRSGRLETGPAYQGVRLPVSTKVKMVAAGGCFSLILTTDGALWVCGDNTYGQLGDGTTIISTIPKKVMTDVKHIAAGEGHTLILKADNSLWGCGSNFYNQLGDGTTEDRLTPVRILDDVKSMTASVHSLILKTDGSLWACGRNNHGQLCDGTTEQQSSPVKVMDDVTMASAGNGHSLILKTDGSLWACGNNTFGQLGDGSRESRRYSPVKVMDDVHHISTGRQHSLILKTDGTLWACGRNYEGRLGNGTTETQTIPVHIMSDVKMTMAGRRFSLILKTDGTLWTCGDNSKGQLVDGTIIDRDTPRQVMGNVRDMAAGYEFSLILKTDGSLWACGNNEYGQLGDGTTENRLAPVRVSLPIE